MADTVLVSGGSGYIAGWCVAQLLERGYAVRASLRSLNRQAEVRRALADVAPAAADPNGPLRFFAADLDNDAGWMQAALGCRYALHVASPVPVAQPSDPDVLIRPAREGALRVLKAAVAGGVERVVMTSSVAAVGEHGHTPIADETEWTDLSTGQVSAYTQSKTLAERAARNFMDVHGGATAFATVNPSLVLGPVMSADYSSSVQVVSRMLQGRMPGLPRIGFSLVDVRDVADLHLRAMTGGAADGRYIAAGEFLWLEEVAALLRQELGSRAAKVPTRRVPDWMVRAMGLFSPDVRGAAHFLGAKRQFSPALAERTLGWKARPASETVRDTAESLLAHGAV